MGGGEGLRGGEGIRGGGGVVGLAEVAMSDLFRDLESDFNRAFTSTSKTPEGRSATFRYMCICPRRCVALRSVTPERSTVTVLGDLVG